MVLVLNRAPDVQGRETQPYGGLEHQYGDGANYPSNATISSMLQT